MNYLFWNTGKKEVNDVLCQLIQEYECDFVALAEYQDNKDFLIHTLKQQNYHLHHIPKIGCQRIDIFTKYAPSRIKHLPETDYYTMKLLPHEKLREQLVVVVHFPSKLHMDEYSFMEQARLLRQDIEKAEEKNNTNKTIIVGDFNINPFETAMVSAYGIHSISSRDISRKQFRTIQGTKYSMFYNPMWNLLGDQYQVSGTYFYSKSVHLNYFWNTFDQVIIRPSLIDNFIVESIKIISSVNNLSLVNKNGKPTISDHLPIFFQII